MAVGRPSKYKPEFCEILIKNMTDGYSFEACCGILGVTKDTGYKWLQKYPEFADAKKYGEVKSQEWWETEGKLGLWSSKENKFNSAVWIFAMKNRFGWRDKKEITGADGGPLQVSNMTSEEIDHKISELLNRLKPASKRKE
jgi:transposase